LTPIQPTYLYSFNYDYHHSALCKLESRQLFDIEESGKVLFSDIAIDPSVSAFIKNRLEIISSAANYADLLEELMRKDIHMEGFNVDYLILEGDTAAHPERRKIQKDIGYCIEGDPDFNHPTITYGIGTYQSIWYFGVLLTQSVDWHKHKQKPRSFSNSLGINIAKTLVNIATKGIKTKTLLDACCGVGTVLLEARFSDYNIEGCDINPNSCDFTRENLVHYNYVANVYCSDIKDLNKNYDAAIIDLPYNHYSYSDDTVALNIISSTAKLTERLVIVSMSDLKPMLEKCGLTITDFCMVEKRGKSKFTRNIWVCEKEGDAIFQ
jgi:tRNA (guanine10-N2)-dimethyltransferase